MAAPQPSDPVTSSIPGEALFVYGTLRKQWEHPLSRMLRRESRFLGEAAFPGRLYDLGEYPGAVRSSVATEWVKGDLFLLSNPAESFGVLDEYEGVAAPVGGVALFRRERCSALLGPGRMVESWVYLFNRPTDGFRRIDSGDFLEDWRLRGKGRAVVDRAPWGRDTRPWVHYRSAFLIYLAPSIQSTTGEC